MIELSNAAKEMVNFEDYLQEHEKQYHADKVLHVSNFIDDALKRLEGGGKMLGDPMPWQKTQDKIRFRPGEVSLWVGPNGCLSGETMIPINRGNRNGFRAYKLSELYYLFNGIKYNNQPDYPVYNHSGWDLSKPTFTKSCDQDGNIAIANQIDGVVYSGEKEVFIVESELGNKIKATKDHKFLTDDGFKRLENINVGDIVYFSGRDCGNLVDVQRRNKAIALLQINNVGNHPNARIRENNGLTYTSHPLHRLVAEAALNNMPLEEFLFLLHGDVDSLIFIKPEAEVHHIDGNRLNNTKENLQVLSKSEHTKIHKYDLIDSRYAHKIRKQKITNITFNGVERTYDIQMKAPHHNFVANNFVVHNSGKSLVMGQCALTLSQITKVAIASFEMPPDSTVSRMLRQAAGSLNTTSQFARRFSDALQLYVYNHIGNLNTETVYGMIHYMAVEKGVKHIMIDSLVKCGVNSEKNEPQKQFLSKVQDIAKEHKIHIHIVHHTRKGQHETDTPDKYSVKGAGELVDLTDNLILVYRNKEKEKKVQELKHTGNESEIELLNEKKPDCFLNISKQRHGDFEGGFGFWFDTDSTQWVDNPNGRRHTYVK